VVLLPLAAIFALLLASSSVSVALTVAVASSLCLAAMGSLYWRGRPESVDVCFRELMLWQFIRRQRAEEKLEDSVSALGIDRAGLDRPMTLESWDESEGAIVEVDGPGYDETWIPPYEAAYRSPASYHAEALVRRTMEQLSPTEAEDFWKTVQNIGRQVARRVVGGGV
jgi:hypothetical protein